MSTMAIIYLVLFFAMTSVHLYASFIKNQYFRGLTKGCLLLLLMGFYLESVPAPEYLLIYALLFSWLGDLFLLGKGVKWFTVGGVAFMVSHALFIATYCTLIDWSGVPIFAIVGFGGAFVLAVCIVFKHLKQYLMPQLVVPMFAYLLLNGAMNCFAIFRLVSAIAAGCVTTGPLVTAIGALLFFTSDSSLFFVRFNKNSIMKSHFVAMLTYTLGEFLIVLGLIL